MQIVKCIILLLIGFIVLVKSSDIFVDAISSIASHCRMSKMMIAITIGAFGTCAPELAISFNSVASNAGDIALANVIGSCIVNIILVIGIACCVAPIKVKNESIKQELPILLVVTTLFVISMVFHSFDNKQMLILTRMDGILYLSFFIMFIFYIFSVIKIKKGVFEVYKPKYSITKSIIYTIICSILIVFASDLLVDSAVELSSLLNVSTKIITMTIVVIGTSLPEMTMTVIAARKGEFDIALGNIIGTNIFNIGVVLGLPLIIYGGFNSTSFNMIDVSAVFVAAACLFLFARNDKKLSSLEGAIMISIFVAYYAYVLLT
jgi:cation:H+ antiporter